MNNRLENTSVQAQALIEKYDSLLDTVNEQNLKMLEQQNKQIEQYQNLISQMNVIQESLVEQGLPASNE